MDERVPELKETLRSLWRRKLIVATLVSLGAGGGFVVSNAQPRVYEASSDILLRPTIPTSGTKLSADLSADSQAQLVRSVTVAERVRARLGTKASIEALTDRIETDLVTREILSVIARAGNPRDAAVLADTFAEEYLGFRSAMAATQKTTLVGELQQRIDDLEVRIADLDDRILTFAVEATRLVKKKGEPQERALDRARVDAQSERLKAERNDLLVEVAATHTELEDARAGRSTPDLTGTVIHKARALPEPVSPRPKRAGAVGFVLGVVAGVGLALLREYLDDRIRSHADASRAASIPVVGVVPRARGWRRKREAFLATLAEPGKPAAEGYRTLRQSLVAMGAGDTVRRVLVTSGGPRAGKSATAANLAVSFAQAGYRTVAVSADRRAPRLHAFFGLPDEGGLADALVDGRPAASVAVDTAVANLTVVPSGALPEGPELLDGPAIRRVLSELSDVADVVVIDAPPIAAGADALALASSTDLSLLVMRRDHARTWGAAAAAAALSRVGAQRVAGVLSMADPREARAAAEGAAPVDSRALVETVAAPNGHTNGHANGHEPADTAARRPARRSNGGRADGRKPNGNGKSRATGSPANGQRSARVRTPANGGRAHRAGTRD